MFYLILEKFVAKNKNLHTTLATTAGSNLKKSCLHQILTTKSIYQLPTTTF